MPEEMDQDIKDLRLDVNGRAIPAPLAPLAIDLAIAEDEDHRYLPSPSRI